MELSRSTPFETIEVTPGPRLWRVKIARPHRNNSIDSRLIHELSSVLEQAESDPNCRIMVLEGEPGVFCTGMDFKEVADNAGVPGGETIHIADYLNLLKKFTLTPIVVIASVDGKVIAGGVGLVAASDLVIATSRTEFSLSEALWGLLPCCVIPFLIRRVGFQKAYTMTLTTRPIGAQEAAAIHLVDEWTDEPAEAIRRLQLRLERLESQTVGDLKAYFRSMWMITPEMEALAVKEITRLTAQPRVEEAIANYVNHGRFPWEKRP